MFVPYSPHTLQKSADHISPVMKLFLQKRTKGYSKILLHILVTLHRHVSIDKGQLVEDKLTSENDDPSFLNRVGHLLRNQTLKNTFSGRYY